MQPFLRIVAVASLTAVLGLSLVAWAAPPADKDQTFNGVVSDMMCGAKHMMAGDAAGCTRACVKQGSEYALVVGNDVYTLKGNQADLDKYAGQQVTVTGRLKGKTIEASSIAPGQAKKS